MIIEFPGSLPPAVARAVGDERIPSELRDALRLLASDDEGTRIEALDVIRDAVDVDEDDTGPRGLRLFPALVALAALREGAERAALIGSASSLELVRLAVDGDVPEGLDAVWDDARIAGLKLCAPLLAEPVDPELLGPLLAALAALQGDGELAGLIASADELIDGTGDTDDDENEE
ncbi:MAG: hypothetical protein Q8O67_00870 [Deltaproteobacteria bacterium]|nr:hypothetical protein [Deltaproteobacteria bacterium]